MRGKAIATGFWEGFIKPTASMTGAVTAATVIGVGLQSATTATYEYAKNKINELDIPPPHPDDHPPNYSI